MSSLRKFLAIAMLALFGLSFASPLLALADEGDASVPVCCRKNGKHHCAYAVSQDGRLINQDASFGAQPEKCPVTPSSLVASQHHSLGLASSISVFAGLQSHPAVFAQTESRWRIAQGRSRQKRGPPASSTLL